MATSQVFKLGGPYLHISHVFCLGSWHLRLKVEQLPKVTVTAMMACSRMKG